MNSILVLAKALRTFGSASYSFTFVAPMHFIRVTTFSGDGRLFAI